MKRIVNIWTSLDWFTVIIYLLLVFMGWINIYAAVYNEEHHSMLDITQRYGKQMIWISAAIILATAVLSIDGNFYSFFAYFIYGLTIFLLIAVLIFGKEVNGARSWFALGSFHFQPSEFAKMATGLALARFMSSYNFKLHTIKSLLIILFIVFSPALLIILQPDMGSAIVYTAFLLVLYREGLSSAVLYFGILVAILFFAALVLDKIIIIVSLVALALLIFLIITRRIKETLIAGIIMAVISAGFFLLNRSAELGFTNYYIAIASILISGTLFATIALTKKIERVFLVLIFLIGSIAFTYSVDYVFRNLLKEHQQRRMNVLLGIESDPLGIGYNINQSKIAIGSGGLTGKGFLNGTQTKFDFVPEQSTDFIFCTVGEEWGFVGTSITLLLFLTLFLRLIYLAERQRSVFSRIYGYSVISILFFHVMVNVGMTVGLLPVIGIPLPFFSYGGSSLWSFTLLLFIFLRLDASRRELLR
ncbi:MAG: rod shape-determining protein RodA [bacterium]